MTMLTANVSATQTLLPVDGASQYFGDVGGYYNLGSEAIKVVGTTATSWLVERGIAGTTAAVHSSGATLTRYYPDASTGGSSAGFVEPTTATPEAIVNSLIAAGVMSGVPGGSPNPLPTADPHSVGVFWNNQGVVMVSAG
jgi:hypothetical protein